MKKYLLLLLFFSINCHAKILQLVTGDFPPYVGSELKNGGLTVEIVTRVFEKLGEQVNVDFRPWKRGYAETLNGMYLATFPYTKNAEREKELYFSDAMYHLEEYFFTRSNDNLNYRTVDDLKNLRICKPQGYNLFSLKELHNNKIIYLEQPKSMAHCFKMLKLQRVDMVMTNKTVGWGLVEEIFAYKNDVRMLEKNFVNIGHFLVIPKSNPKGKEIIMAFNTALHILKQDGLIELIQAKYINAQGLKK